MPGSGLTLQVYVIVLSYENYDDTRECLESLAALEYSRYEIVVVDNGSRDDSAGRLQEDFPACRVIRNDENLGYAGGNNVGISYALEHGADAVWLLNNDTTVHPAALSRLVEASASLPDAGILGTMIFYYDAPGNIHFAGGELIRGRGKGRHIGGEEVRDSHFKTPLRSDFITGASLLVRREMLEETGGLDESFFLYLEDLDWALRARRAGWYSYIVPGAVVWHKVNRTAEIHRPQIIYYVCRNSLYLSRRHFPVRLPQVMLWCIYSYVVAYLVKWVLEGFSRDVLDYARMGLLGLGDFMRGRMGKYVERD